MEKFKYPCIKTYRISSKYGTRIHPITKVQSFHNGVDIACPEGTTLKNTIGQGICTKVGHDSLNGNFLRIEHDNGFLTSYAHLSKVICKEGVSVEVGELFALTGNTGRSSGAHVHFRVRKKDGVIYRNVDPELYFEF